MSELTQAYLKEFFGYDADTGDWTRTKKTKKCKRYGPDWEISSWGYLTISLQGRTWGIHRLIWLREYGYWPNQIDHINHDPADNRLCNLRNANPLINQRNRRLGKNNTSGHFGVHWINRDQVWIAKIKLPHKSLYLGRFQNKDKAIIARKEAEKKYGFHENHGSRM